MKKRRIAALLLASMACVSALNAGAAWSKAYSPGESADLGTGIIVPFWDNTQSVSCNLKITGKTATCSSTISGKSGTTSITGTLTLYRQSGKSWVYVDSWSDTSSSSTLRFSEEKTVSSGYSYKLIVRATVTRNGTNESVEKESATKYCG